MAGRKIDVFYDGPAFENRTQRGVQRYFRELIEGAGEGYRSRMWIGRRIYAEPPKNCRTTIWPLGSRVRRQARALHWLFARKPDVYHSTYFTLPPYRGEFAVVQTVHDMIPEVMQDEVGSWWRDEMEMKRRAMAGADLVIAISHATAADVRRIHPQLSEKIRVVHHGADHLARVAERVSGGESGERYVMIVGDRWIYKNFTVVLGALAERGWPTGLKVKIVGPALLEEEKAAIEKTGRAGAVEFVGRLSDAELQQVMGGAVGVVYPSLMEGFGFPVLEAQAAGTLIICSDIGIFRELGGDGAVYFDPRSAESLCGALQRAMEGAGRREAIDAGLENVKRFTWKRCVEQTHAVYQEAMRMRAGTGLEQRVGL